MGTMLRGAASGRAEDGEVGRALGLQRDLMGRRVQSVMLHAMRLRLAQVGLTAQVDLTAPGAAPRGVIC